ncbi:hypothetical protein VE04_09398 [Pseudogymnoascus sp. 24MN13]|nr:hypothetical protein VE04_09398 [Pseudogymnoascus sp. 24MN13]
MNSLLTELGLLNKRYSVVRIPGLKSQQFYNSEGSTYIIPIRVKDGYRLTVDGRPLVPGEITYITTAVMLIVSGVVVRGKGGKVLRVVVVKGRGGKVIRVVVVEGKGGKILRVVIVEGKGGKVLRVVVVEGKGGKVMRVVIDSRSV